MDKNRTEKEKLYQWACKFSQNDRIKSIFTPVKKECDSYYENVENREYIREYEPETAHDINEELLSLWDKDEILEQARLICTVACMKNKDREVLDETTVYKKSKKQLKPYIYEF